MRIDIVVPTGPAKSGISVYAPVLPRGPLAVAARLTAKQHVVKVIDGYSYPHVLDEYVIAAVAEPPDLIGISIHAAPALGPAMRLAKRLQDAHPEQAIIFGGNFTRIAPEIVQAHAPRGSVIVPDASDAALSKALLGALRRDATPPQIISGDTLDRPDWEIPFSFDALSPAFARYLVDADFEYHLGTQDGCPFRCFHCGTGRKGLFGRADYRDMRSFAAELQALARYCAETARPRPNLWITDETFISDGEQAAAACSILAQTGPWKWRAQTRIDCAPKEILRLMAAAGCEQIAFGVEIPNDHGLQSLGKREDMAAAAAAFRAAQESGLATQAIVVVGTPNDQTSLKALLDGIEALGADSVQAYIYHPVPGSPWWRKHGSAHMTAQRDWWDGLDFHTTPVSAPPEARQLATARFLALLLWEKGDVQGSQPTARPSLRQSSRTSCGCTHHNGLQILEETPAVTIGVLDGDAMPIALAYDRRTGRAVSALLDTHNIYRSAAFFDDPQDVAPLLRTVCSFYERTLREHAV